VRAEPRFYLGGTNELTGLRRTERFLGSHFTYYDLGAPFLLWQNEKFLGEDIMRGQECFILETATSNAPYARVKMWIHKEYFALLRAEAFDDGGALVKRFMISSFKKIGDVWIPRGVEIADVPPGQALPAQEKSRLEIYEGNYDTELPAEWFLPERFSELKDAPARTSQH
jgi:outer membrane lipoprotein-sorting protein